MSVVCAAAAYAARGMASVSEPSLAIANVEMESLAVFAVKAQRPLFVTATQQAAACVVAAEPVIKVNEPSAFSWYEDAAERPAGAPAASETTSSSRSPNAKPKGVEPDEWKLCGAPAAPDASTTNVSRVLVALFVTTSALPDGENWICAGPLPSSDRTEPAIGERPVLVTAKPAMVRLPALRT